MISELDTRWCTSEDAEPRRGVDTGQCASEDSEPRREWIVRPHIGWKEEWNILYKGVETYL